MHKHRRRKSKFLVWFLIVAGSVMTVSLSGLLKIKRVDCYTQFGTCRPEISSNLSWLVNYRLLRPLPGKQVQQQLSQFSDVKKISLYRRLPSTVVVSVQLRRPIGLVGTTVLGASTLVDEEGISYQQKDRGAYPLLLLPELPALGTQLDKRVVSALSSLTLMSNLSGKTITGSISNDSLVASLSGQTEMIVSLSDSPEKWYPSLQVILNRSKIKGKMPRKIDLRFDNLVISY